MPLSDASVAINLKFSLEKLIAGWPASEQGENLIQISLNSIDPAVWNEGYGIVFTLTSGTQAIDLNSLTNFLSEAFAFTSVLALAIKVTGGNISLKKATSNGCPLFFAGTSGIAINDGEGMAFVGAGWPVTPTTNNLTVTWVSGTAVVTFAVIGSTL